MLSSVSLVIISFILMTRDFDSGVTLFGELHSVLVTLLVKGQIDTKAEK